MQEFIQSVAKRLGIEESVARTLTAKVLTMIKGNVDDANFSALTEKLPGADDLLATQEGSAQGGESGGMLGGLTKMAASVLGGGAGQGVELAGMMKEAGLNEEQSGSFLSTLIGFLKQKAGPGILAPIAEKIPALKALLG